ncbi:GNAT family N-acetyltransferase [Pseudonocardia sp. WMMC193]|uniref:GNAT family N-acetyltransferase n=1 Tax=Pseudonocardia sp. WMMC193 TaxID=2911965 RepID=UPI001F426874|nr:GNAT family N-acetyltransferase [Pseudonocardia sp. WMMC193]MCF7549272.1 N-acetyltransferase [Pseudonocardia sp. WMMC193]
MSEPMVLDVPEWSRFEIHVDGRLAGFAQYRTEPGTIRFIHTEIDEAYEGQGLGGKLARFALDAARTRGLAVYPDCPFIRGWIAKHEDYQGLVPVEARPLYGL